MGEVEEEGTFCIARVFRFFLKGDVLLENSVVIEEETEKHSEPQNDDAEGDEYGLVLFHVF